jgi:hypothetical protein
MAINDPNVSISSPDTAPSEQMEEAKQSLKETAREQGQHIAQKAGEKSEEIKAMAKQRAESAFSNQKSRVAEVLDDTAQALHRTASQFQEQHRDTAADYAEKVASQLARASSVVREKDMGYFVRETENFARRQPKLFLGGALAAGFLLARFLKSSGGYVQRSESRPPSHGESTQEPFQPGETPSSEFQMSH